MAHLQPHIDWHELSSGVELSSTTRERFRRLLGLLGLALAIIWLRAVQLELSDGERFRQWAARPRERAVSVQASRGRILARDGTVLATDARLTGLSVAYRYLQQPPDPKWLRAEARKRLSRADRRNPAALSAMEDRVRAEIGALHLRLSDLCDVSVEEWAARTSKIVRRVEELSARVNRQRQGRYDAEHPEAQPSGDDGWLSVLRGLFAPPAPLPPSPVVIVEETAYHRIVDDLPNEVIDEIANHAERYLGVKLAPYTRREYPTGTLAANLLGHTTAVEAGLTRENPAEDATIDRTVRGLMGIERDYESTLRGQAGEDMQTLDRLGRLLSVDRLREPHAGQDVVLSIDPRLQQAAQTLLERALRKREPDGHAPRGGAALVMEIDSGQLLVAASAPGFDPNPFARGDTKETATVLADSRGRMFDRAMRMAIAPGSVFKPLTAIALVETGVVDPRAEFRCQGFWQDPDQLRCQLFRQYGIGHGDLALPDALAQSCNVYFFDHALSVGPRLVDWARRLGFSQPTVLDGAAKGHLPSADELRKAGAVQMMAIGQGGLTATPLEVARLYAAIATGDRLPRPRLDLSPASAVAAAGNESISLSRKTTEALREGLVRTVNDPNGTAYETVRLPSITIAGKTGTAETGSRLGDHAWFAGYVPAEGPRFVIVVALEHGGSGATAAGPVAKALVQRLEQTGYLTSGVRCASAQLPVDAK